LLSLSAQHSFRDLQDMPISKALTTMNSEGSERHCSTQTGDFSDAAGEPGDYAAALVKRLGKYVVDRAFYKACKNGHLAIAQRLRGLITREDLELDVILAATCRRGHLNVASWLEREFVMRPNEAVLAVLECYPDNVQALKWLEKTFDLPIDEQYQHDALQINNTMNTMNQQINIINTQISKIQKFYKLVEEDANQRLNNNAQDSTP
jgi:hypothetical protein